MPSLFTLAQVLFLLFLFAPLSFSSEELDRRYSYKNIAAAVINAVQEPVHGEHVEGEMLSLLRREPRFEFSESGYATLKAGLKPVTIPPVETPTNAMLLPLSKTLKELAAQGVPAVILAEVGKSKERQRILFLLVSTQESKILFSQEVEVNRSGMGTGELENFSSATREGLQKILKGIPFDATVSKRDGYRVVLDRGGDVFHQGMEIPTYTIEDRNGQISFEETGLITITQVDESLSFGKIMAENRPREVAMGNKIRLGDSSLPPLTPLVFGEEAGRSLASYRETFEVTKGKLGVVQATFGPSILTLDTASATAGDSSSSLVSPRGGLRAELWLTSKYFAEMGLGYGIASLGLNSTGEKQRVGTSASDFKFMAGYRFNLFAPDPGPVLKARLGFGSYSFSYGESKSATVPHADTSYSGIMIGGGVQFHAYEGYSAAIDINTLIFPSVSNSRIAPGSAGAGNVSAWEAHFRAIYDYSSELDFEAKLLIQKNAATFSEASIGSASQTSVGAIAAVTYYY